MIKIFFDLDGTLIDSRNRLYTLFQELVPESQFTFDEYWSMKRNKINHQQILSQYFPKIDFTDFNLRWLTQIESPQMLGLDTLYPHAQEMLKLLKDKTKLYVLTARQHENNLLDELEKLKIKNFFNNILLTKHQISKEELIKTLDTTPNDILIGDTGYDIQTGKACGLKTIAITHGFLSKEILETYSPDIIIDTLKKLNNILIPPCSY